MERMRTRLPLLPLLAALLVLASACAGDTEGDGAAGTTGAGDESALVHADEERADVAGADAEGAEAGTESTAAYPVTIEHAYGSTELAERPERIVTLNVQWTDAVLAMGVTPAAYMLSANAGEADPYPWQDGMLEGAERIDNAGTIPCERIAALAPDLILVTFAITDESEFETLAEIAPTIALLGDLQVDPWQDQVATMGEILGEPEQATMVIDQVESEVAGTATELPGLAGKTYALANYVPGDGIWVIADPDDGSSRLFYDLGMEIDPGLLALDAEAVGRVQISFEQLAVLGDADYLGMLFNGEDPEAVTGLDELGPVQAGGFTSFELVDIVGLNTPTPLSVPYLVDLMRPELEAVAAAE